MSYYVSAESGISLQGGMFFLCPSPSPDGHKISILCVLCGSVVNKLKEKTPRSKDKAVSQGRQVQWPKKIPRQHEL